MAEYDLIVKALSERYMDQIASFVRGVAVEVERIVDKEAVAVLRTSDVLYKVKEDGYEYLMLVEFQTRQTKRWPGGFWNTPPCTTAAMRSRSTRWLSI